MRFVPIDDVWEPRARGELAWFRSGDVEVLVGTEPVGGELPLRGEIRNLGTDTVRVRVVAERSPAAGVVVARVADSGTWMPWGPTEDVVAGGVFEIPAKSWSQFGCRQFRLRPDPPRPDSGAPDGATFSYALVWSAGTDDVNLPLRFRVEPPEDGDEMSP